MWLPGRWVARAASRHLPSGVTSIVRGPSAAARSVAHWLTRRGFVAEPESPGVEAASVEALVVLGRLDEARAAHAALMLRDGGRFVACRVPPPGKRHAMRLTAWLAHAGFIEVGQRRGAGAFSVHTTFATFRLLPAYLGDEARDSGDGD